MAAKTETNTNPKLQTNTRNQPIPSVQPYDNKTPPTHDP